MRAKKTKVVKQEIQEEIKPAELTFNDLKMLASIIDLASKRGAFQAADLSIVGDAFNKLTAFLKYVDSMQQKDEVKQETPAA